MESAYFTSDGPFASGNLPFRQNTALAEVLMRLLAGESLTGMDAVFDASTTRLAAKVFQLETSHGWKIERRTNAVACSDGRVSYVKVYYLNPQAIEAAMVTGAATWCAETRVARRELRAKAAKAKLEAQRANAARQRRQLPGQLGLFGAGDVV